MMFAHTLASTAAQQAVRKTIETFGEEHKAFLYHGTAWVTIRPARGAFINSLKQHRVGRKGDYGGWVVGCSEMGLGLPPTLSGSLDLKEIAARAYADTLKTYGISAGVNTRAD